MRCRRCPTRSSTRACSSPAPASNTSTPPTLMVTVPARPRGRSDRRLTTPRPSGKDRVPRNVCTVMRGLMGLVVLGAGLALAGPAAAADQTIAFQNYSYSATPTTIKTGDTATFNGSFMSHPLVWDANNFATTNTGSSRSFSFSQPGTYLYHCQIHAQTQGMVGQLTVVADQHPAAVSFGVSPSPRAGQPVTFTYTGSADPDG